MAPSFPSTYDDHTGPNHEAATRDDEASGGRAAMTPTTDAVPASATGANTAMAVMGDLSDIGIAGLLHLLGLQGATGQLRIVADGDEVGLFLEQGRLVLVTSARLSLRLGRVLQQRGLLDARQLHEALRQQETTDAGRSLGTILLGRGWVTLTDLTRCVEDQSIAVLARVMAAAHGSFFCYTPSVAAPAEVATVPLDAERILIAAMQRVDELSRLRTEFPQRHAPLAASAMAGVMVTARTPTEDQIVAALRAGASSVAELEELLPVDETMLLRTLLDMRRRGMIVAGQGAPGGDVGVAGEPPPSEADLSTLFAASVAG